MAGGSASSRTGRRKRNRGVIELMTSAKTEEHAQTETPEKDGPLLDLTDAAVKKLI